MPKVAVVGWNIIDNRWLTKSPWAYVMSDGVSSTIYQFLEDNILEAAHNQKTEATHMYK